MTKRTYAEYFRLIVKHQLEAKFFEKDEDDPAMWSVFPMKAGGHHGHGPTLQKAIEDCIRTNRLE